MGEALTSGKQVLILLLFLQFVKWYRSRIKSMRQKHKRFNKKLKSMPVVNLRNFGTFFILVYAVEEGALILKQLVY